MSCDVIDFVGDALLVSLGHPPRRENEELSPGRLGSSKLQDDLLPAPRRDSGGEIFPVQHEMQLGAEPG